MIVVSDTTPLISLLKINRLELLEKLYGFVYIPRAVFDELTVNTKYQAEADEISNAKFIECKDITNIQALKILQVARTKI